MTSISSIEYKEFTAKDIGRLGSMYELRENKSCDAAPLTCFVYREEYKLYYYLEENKALTLMFVDKNGNVNGFIPYCKKESLPEYFRLQEQYYNKILGIPLVIYSADYEGVEYLKNAGVLDNYIVEEAVDLRDYIYDAGMLRTLSGKKMVKKRNHVNRFLRDYEGRWEYKSLTYEDRNDIIEFENRWLKAKVGESGTEDEEDLFGEKRGIEDIVSEPELYNRFKFGGIYIDGRMMAFSIGDYNSSERMAVISVEKADGSINGLYQVINKEFLAHEFPDAVIVNREDDVGIEGLRKAKLSYHPIAFERKFTLRQKVRFLKNDEHNRTLQLFRECFGDDDEFIEGYYGNERRKEIAVMEDGNGNIISMAHVVPRIAEYADGRSEEVSYILCVATKEECRGRGYMKEVMEYVMQYLRLRGEQWCFLVPVDKKIYQGLGFEYTWKLSEKELDILYADDGLETASAALLNAGVFESPVEIRAEMHDFSK